MILLVGQTPPRGGLPEGEAFYGTDSWKRFLQLVELPDQEVRRAVITANLIDHYIGSSGKYDQFDFKLGKRGAQDIQSQLHTTTATEVWMAGRTVARAWGMRGEAPMFTATRATYGPWEGELVIIPHPGGTNMWWNDAEKKASAKAWLRGRIASHL